MTTPDNIPLLAQRFRRALALRTKCRLHEASPDDVSAAVADAGLRDASWQVLGEVIETAMSTWRADCAHEMRAALHAWEPSEAERARPN